MSSLLTVLVVVSALGSALVAGVFYAFSTFVMPALRRLPHPQAIAAMQEINIMAPSAGLMIAMIGTAATSLAVVVIALMNLSEPYAIYLLAAGVIYLVGSPIVTMAYHVPRNNALATLDMQSTGAAEHWARYDSEWTRANHLRFILPLAAAALYIAGLLVA